VGLKRGACGGGGTCSGSGLGGAGAKRVAMRLRGFFRAFALGLRWLGRKNTGQAAGVGASGLARMKKSRKSHAATTVAHFEETDRGKKNAGQEGVSSGVWFGHAETIGATMQIGCRSVVCSGR